MTETGPSRVSVIIPTRNRPKQVVAAVRSALDQTVVPHEVIIVVDGTDSVTVQGLQALENPSVHIFESPVPQGAAGARNSGIAAATGDLIAFLDDDDFWLPGKLEAQLAVFRTDPDPNHLVLGTQTFWDDGTATHIWPRRRPRPAESVGDYLFVRDAAGEGLLPTPTIMLSRSFAAACPFDTHLGTHEEWDWFLNLQARGARFDVVLQPLARVDGRPRRSSITTTAGWRTSLAWSLARAADLGETAFSGFVLNEVDRTAVDSGSRVRDRMAIGWLGVTGRPRLTDITRFLFRPLVRSRHAMPGRCP